MFTNLSCRKKRKTWVMALYALLACFILQGCKSTENNRSELMGGNFLKRKKEIPGETSGLAEVFYQGTRSFFTEYLSVPEKHLPEYNVDRNTFNKEDFYNHISWGSSKNTRIYSNGPFGALRFWEFNWKSKNGIKQKIKFDLRGPLNGEVENGIGKIILYLESASFAEPYPNGKPSSVRTSLSIAKADSIVTVRADFGQNKATNIKVSCCRYNR